MKKLLGKLTPSDVNVARKVWTDHYDLGYSKAEAARRNGVSLGTAYGWFHREDRWFPFIDEVAMERALAGDRQVLERMTVWERQEITHRIADMDFLAQRKLAHDWQMSWNTLIQALGRSGHRGRFDPELEGEWRRSGYGAVV